MREGVDLVESPVYWPAELDANIPSAIQRSVYRLRTRVRRIAIYLNFSSAFALRKVISKRVFMNLPQLTL